MIKETKPQLMSTESINSIKETRQTFKTVPSVYLVLVSEGKILLSKRANTGYEDGNYGLVSGHIEAKESLRSGMARELEEEIGIAVVPADIALALVMHRYSPTSNPPERMDFFMRIEKWSGDIINMEPHKCSELKWFEIANLPTNTIPYIKYALEQIACGSSYCEHGWG